MSTPINFLTVTDEEWGIATGQGNPYRQSQKYDRQLYGWNWLNATSMKMLGQGDTITGNGALKRPFQFGKNGSKGQMTQFGVGKNKTDGFIYQALGTVDALFKDKKENEPAAAFEYHGKFNTGQWHKQAVFEVYNDTDVMYPISCKGFSFRLYIPPSNDNTTSNNCTQNWGDELWINNIHGLWRSKEDHTKYIDLNLYVDGRYNPMKTFPPPVDLAPNGWRDIDSDVIYGPSRGLNLNHGNAIHNVSKENGSEASKGRSWLMGNYSPEIMHKDVTSDYYTTTSGVSGNTKITPQSQWAQVNVSAGADDLERYDLSKYYFAGFCIQFFVPDKPAAHCFTGQVVRVTPIHLNRVDETNLEGGTLVLCEPTDINQNTVEIKLRDLSTSEWYD